MFIFGYISFVALLGPSNMPGILYLKGFVQIGPIHLLHNWCVLDLTWWPLLVFVTERLDGVEYVVGQKPQVSLVAPGVVCLLLSCVFFVAARQEA